MTSLLSTDSSDWNSLFFSLDSSGNFFQHHNSEHPHKHSDSALDDSNYGDNYEYDIQEEYEAQLEHDWELLRPQAKVSQTTNSGAKVPRHESGSIPTSTPQGIHHLQNSQIFVVHYPNAKAGTLIPPPSGQQSTSSAPFNPWTSFSSQLDWKIAKWAKLRGPGLMAFLDLLAISGVKERLNLSFNNSHKLNQIIDNELPCWQPCFLQQEVVVKEEFCKLYYHDILGCIRSLWADCNFAKWWWEMQKTLDEEKEGGTVIPVMILSDKTTLMTFGGKMAYPIYMTIGNIPKDIRHKPSRHAQVLISYLLTALLKHVPKAAHCHTLGNLFHACVDIILSPLKDAGKNGVAMQSSDGTWCRCHPIFVTFIGDYLEQLLVTCLKKGECPICTVPASNIGSSVKNAEPRDDKAIREALSQLRKGSTVYSQACAAAGIKLIQHPFWEHLPFVNIYQSITSDILHQIYQGVIKHMVAWL
ncbi:hypothetical protein AX16_009886 [Volvariella volvacea WC 439]|nr:hypothetical protein AX16_009886 [Volvariella volvacea WC 439]